MPSSGWFTSVSVGAYSVLAHYCAMGVLSVLIHYRALGAFQALAH